MGKGTEVGGVVQCGRGKGTEVEGVEPSGQGEAQKWKGWYQVDKERHRSRRGGTM